jgi:hypothetical protein
VSTAAKPTIRNGVDTDRMFATLDLIKAQPDAARVQFRAVNRWIEGAHNRSAFTGFYPAGGEDTTRGEACERDACAAAILLGSDTGPNPAVYQLHARVTGDAAEETLREVVERARERSAVYGGRP